jgi:hypothetical protein
LLYIKQKNGSVKVSGRMSDGTGPLKKGKDMTPALSVSVAGLLDASTRLSTAATRISRQSATGFSTLARSGISDNASPAAATGRSLSAADLSEALPMGGNGAALYTPSYAEDIVAMKMASAAYKANAKMLKASSEMSKELIETLR